MTGILDALIAFVIAGILNLMILQRVRAMREDGAFLARIYAWTLGLRYALAVFLNAYAGDSVFAATFWGDSGGYDAGGRLLAQAWGGAGVYNNYYVQSVSGYGFYYFVGAIYYLFGENQLLVQFVNGTIGAITVLVIYAIAADLFDPAVARWAALFMAFFPQMIFWSAAMYKDPAILLCIALCIYSALKLQNRFRPGFVFLYVVSALALMTLRFYVFYFVAAATLGSFVLSQRRGFVGSLVPTATLAVAVLGAFSLVIESASVERQRSYMDLTHVQVTRSDQAMFGQSAFAAGTDVSTPAGALQAMPVGFIYLMFAPFPWAISGLRQALTLPETLVWYALMPAFARGLLHTLRHRFRDALPILVFALSLTAAYSVFQGNVGTAYRQRTQITMFFFIFMGVGLEIKKQQRASKQSPSLRAAVARLARQR